MKNKIRVLSVILFVLVFLFQIFSMTVAAFAAPEAVGAELYVSPEGNDANDGSFDSPLKTIAAAKEKLKQQKDTLPSGATVYLREGTYFLSSAVEFTAEDAGNVRFTAYNGEKVTLSGSKAVMGFTEDTVNGVTAFVKELESSDILDFETLYHPTQNIGTPRYPQTGALTVKDVDAADNIFTEENTFWEASLGNTSFNAKEGDITFEFSNPEEMYVRVIHRWIDELSHVTAYEPETGKVRFERPASAVIEPGDEYWFENVFEALNAPGEWYLDRSENRLWYVPFEGEKAQETVLYAGNTTRLIDIDGCDGLTFEGISFRDTEWTLSTPVQDGSLRSQYNIDALQAGDECDAAFNIQNSDNIVFRGCDFINIGNSALRFIKNVHDSSVENCFFSDIGSTAIAIYGECIPEDAENAGEIMSNINVINNLIERYGQNTYESIGVHIKYARDCKVSHNEVHDGHYSGMSIGWMWSHDPQVTKNIQVTDNLIYNIGMGWLGDIGGIYTLGEQRGTVLSGNVIYNVVCGKGKTSYGGNGIYNDAGSSFMTIENNLIYDCTANGLNVSNFSDEQYLRNNIVAFCNQSALLPGICESGTYPCKAENNILVSDDAAVILDARKGALEESNNLLWDYTNGEKLFFSNGYNGDLANAAKIRRGKAEKNGFLSTDTIADPLFVNAAERDFRLRENSPALAMGFVEWDITAAGTLKDTVIGTSTEGGSDRHAHVNDLSSYPKTCSDLTLVEEYGWRVALTMLSVMLIVASVAAVVCAAKKKIKVCRVFSVAAMLFTGVILYNVFCVQYSDLKYMIVSVLFLAQYGVIAMLSYLLRNENVKRKKLFVVWLTGTLALLLPFYATIYGLNNILVIGNVEAVLVSLGLAAVFTVLTIAFFPRKRKQNKANENS